MLMLAFLKEIFHQNFKDIFQQNFKKHFYEICYCYIADSTFIQSLNRCLLVSVQPLRITATITNSDVFLFSVLYVFILSNINYDFALCYCNNKATCTTFIQHDTKWISWHNYKWISC